jgi:hypothetical protein
MARGFGKLTAKKVEHQSKRGMHADGGGLYLQVPRVIQRAGSFDTSFTVARAGMGSARCAM